MRASAPLLLLLGVVIVAAAVAYLAYRAGALDTIVAGL